MGLFTSKTSDATDLEALVKRVGRASGPDPELDAAIWTAIVSAEPGLAGEAGMLPLPVTASLDNALAIAERVLPDWTWKLNQVDKGTKHYKCTFEPRKGSPARGFHEKTAALAVVDALLRALLDRKAA
jgi:hypothetical protein